MRMRWFLYPGYYQNKTWEEQFADQAIVGHFSTSSCTLSQVAPLMNPKRALHLEPSRVRALPRRHIGAHLPLERAAPRPHRRLAC